MNTPEYMREHIFLFDRIQSRPSGAYPALYNTRNHNHNGEWFKGMFKYPPAAISLPSFYKYYVVEWKRPQSKVSSYQQFRWVFSVDVGRCSPNNPLMKLHLFFSPPYSIYTGPTVCVCVLHPINCIMYVHTADHFDSIFILISVLRSIDIWKEAGFCGSFSNLARFSSGDNYSIRTWSIIYTSIMRVPVYSLVDKNKIKNWCRMEILFIFLTVVLHLAISCWTLRASVVFSVVAALTIPDWREFGATGLPCVLVQWWIDL